MEKKNFGNKRWKLSRNQKRGHLGKKKKERLKMNRVEKGNAQAADVQITGRVNLETFTYCERGKLRREANAQLQGGIKT